ncbi:hypothetical protein HOY80DRAFT_1133974 [Tuber brumale]|nr:hypothetical protein HOY80DRAFT_1133974 [Tuber brumale]
MSSSTQFKCNKRSLPSSPLSSPLPTSSLVTPVSLKSLADHRPPGNEKICHRSPSLSTGSSKRRRVAEPEEAEDTLIADADTPAGSANSESMIGENCVDIVEPDSATEEDPDGDWPGFLDFLNKTQRIVESSHQKMRQLSKNFENMRSNYIGGLRQHERDRIPGGGTAVKEQTEGLRQVQANAAEEAIHDIERVAPKKARGTTKSARRAKQ